MKNPIDLSPERFGLPATLQWSEAPERLGTVVVDHTLQLDSHDMRAICKLNGADADIPGESWSGLGITIPGGWDTGRYPTTDDANRGALGVDYLSEATGGNNTILRQGTVGSLAISLATFYRVGPNARVVTIEPSPTFDPSIARQYAEAEPWQMGGLWGLKLTDAQRALLQESGYDPAKYFAASTLSLPTSKLHVTRTGSSTIIALSHDLILPTYAV